MIKRKINQEYLRCITAHDVRNERMDALLFTDTIREFAKDHLSGIMEMDIHGFANGYIELKMPVVSYFIRLLCEDTEDVPVKFTVILTDKLTVKTTYPKIRDHQMTAYLISVARLAGFKADRDGDTLIFSTNIHVSPIMQIYAVSSNDFMYWLVTTYNM